jgi:L-glutamine-phosphate cytidylyltransferase
MRAVILAAGRGSRMGEYTVDRPKCLVELRGRSLLDRQVAALRAAGADEVAVVAGWRAELFDGLGHTVFVNDRWDRTTMVESLATAGSWLRAGPVLVSYGDIVYSAATARTLAAAGQSLAIAYDPGWRTLWERRFDVPLEDAETFRLDERGLLTEIGGRPFSAEEVQGQYLGLLKFTPPAWSLVERVLRTESTVDGLDMTALLAYLLREHPLEIGAAAVSGPWCEFDHPADVEVGHAVLDELDREESRA